MRSVTVYATRRVAPGAVADAVGSAGGVLVGVTAASIVDDGFGGMTAGTLTGRAPSTSAPATSATMIAAAARSTSTGRPAERRDRKTGSATGVTVATGPRSAARAPIASHKSGARTSSSDAKRRRRSSIAISQKVSKATAPAGQVRPHGKTVAAQSIGDLADG